MPDDPLGDFDVLEDFESLVDLEESPPALVEDPLLFEDGLEAVSDDVLVFVSDEVDDFSPDSLVWAFFLASEG